MRSGIQSLLMILSRMVIGIVTGALVSALGYYAPFMIFSSAIMSIGAGLLTLFIPDISEGNLIIVFGVGICMGMEAGWLGGTNGSVQEGSAGRSGVGVLRTLTRRCTFYFYWTERLLQSADCWLDGLTRSRPSHCDKHGSNGASGRR